MGNAQSPVLPVTSAGWEDIQQGAWGSCKITSFVAAVALNQKEQHRDLLRHMFPVGSEACREWGIHVMRVWCTPLEAWRYIVLDEDIPVGLLGGSKTTHQLFYTLMEKAWVKTAGGFLAIDDDISQIGDEGSDSGSDSGSDGGRSDSGSELSEGAGMDDRGSGSDSDEGEDESVAYGDTMPYQVMGYKAIKPNRGLHYAWQGHDETTDGPKTAADFFNLLEEMHASGGICCMSGMPAAATVQLGICGGHDYSVLEAKRVQVSAGDVCMVLLRNPWGKVRWKGKYSHLDNESWTEEFKAALGVQGPDIRGGAFWMEVGDVFTHYEGLNAYSAIATLP